MRTLCDVCESAPAILFCAADEAALCSACDQQVHLCNKLASRHVRVGLADPSDVSLCDICEDAPGGKRTHGRYLLFRQRVEFPGDKPGIVEDSNLRSMDQVEGRRDRFQPPEVPMLLPKPDEHGKVDKNLIDLNSRPNRIHGQTSNNQGVNGLNGCYEESADMDVKVQGINGIIGSYEESADMDPTRF